VSCWCGAAGYREGLCYIHFAKFVEELRYRYTEARQDLAGARDDLARKHCELVVKCIETDPRYANIWKEAIHG
jgi:hypothetical protein